MINDFNEKTYEIFFFVLYFFLPVLSIAQALKADKIHVNKEIKEVFVEEVSQYSVTFRYPGENVSQALGKIMIEKIEFSSGREEVFERKVQPVRTVEDYDKVYITFDANEIAGLKSVDNVHAKARGFTGFSGINSVTRRAIRKLKMEAAFKGANVVYIADTYQRGLGAVYNAMASYSGMAYNTNPQNFKIDEIKPFLEEYSYFLLQTNKLDKNWFTSTKVSRTDVFNKRGEINVFTFDNVIDDNGSLYVESKVLNSGQILKVIFATEERITLYCVKRNTIFNYVLISEKEQRIQRAMEVKQGQSK